MLYDVFIPMSLSHEQKIAIANIAFRPSHHIRGIVKSFGTHVLETYYEKHLVFIS